MGSRNVFLEPSPRLHIFAAQFENNLIIFNPYVGNYFSIPFSEVEVYSRDGIAGSWVAITSLPSQTVIGFKEDIELRAPKKTGGLTYCLWDTAASVYAKSPEIEYSNPRVCSALNALRRAETTRRKGFEAILAFLQEPGRIHGTPTFSIASLLHAHRWARVWYPREIACLTGSAALAYEAWRQGINVRFVIGVHTIPFYAHSWVEYEEKVVNDHPEVRDYLAPVFTLDW